MGKLPSSFRLSIQLPSSNSSLSVNFIITGLFSKVSWKSSKSPTIKAKLSNPNTEASFLKFLILKPTVEQLYIESNCCKISGPRRSAAHFLFLLVALRPNAVHGFSVLKFLDHTQRRTTVCRTPLDE